MIQDEYMLFSYVNMRLRDTSETLEDIASMLGTNKTTIINNMKEIGYEYNEEERRFE